jgi:hypothetical protein
VIRITYAKLSRGFFLNYSCSLLSLLGMNSSSSSLLREARCCLGCRRGGPVDRSEAVERDGYCSTVGVMIWIGAGAAWMVGWDFLKQFKWRTWDRMGKILSKRDPTPQNLTAITEIIPNPDTAPKFFIHPPQFCNKTNVRCITMMN